jgi:hypothetical protein
MKPESVDATQNPMVIKHKCERCRKVISNKVSPEDSMDLLIEIAHKSAIKYWENP